MYMQNVPMSYYNTFLLIAAPYFTIVLPKSSHKHNIPFLKKDSLNMANSDCIHFFTFFSN